MSDTSLPDHELAATPLSPARRLGPGVLLLDWARRKPTLAMMAAVNLLVTALAIGLAIWKWRDADEQNQQKEAALADAAANGYITQIARAEREWLANNVVAADRILEECPPAQRGWEWSYLKRLCHNAWFTLTGPANLQHVMFTPDGQRLLALGVNLDPAGKRQVAVLKTWDSTAGKELTSLQLPGSPVPFSLSPNGRYLALVADHTVPTTPGDAGAVAAAKIVDTATGKEVASFHGHKQAISSMAFSADGRHVASASFMEVKVWEAARGKQVLSLPADVRGLNFSPDGKHLAGLGGLAIKLWDTTSGKESLALRFPRAYAAGIPTLVYSPDGRQLALARATEVHVWETTAGKEVLTLYGRDFRFQTVTYSPDGQYLASANDDQTVRIWDVSTGQETLVLRGHTRDVKLVAYSPDGRRLASAAADGTIKIWDVTLSRKTSPSPGGVQGTAVMAVSPDGLWLAKAPMVRGAVNGVLMRNVLTGDEETWPLPGFAGSLMALAFSPDSRRLALSCFGAHGQDKDKIETQIRFLDVASGRETGMLDKLSGPITCLAYSPDGKRLATAAYQLRLWDLASGKELLTLEGENVTGMVFSPDGRHIACAVSDKTVKIWDATSGQELLRIPHVTHPVGLLAYSPDGQRLTTASPRELKVWDAHTGQELSTPGGFRAPPKGAAPLALSPDGQRVAGGSLGALKIWDAMSGQEIFALVQKASVAKLAFSANGQRLVAPEQVWDAEPLTPEVVAARRPSWEKAALRWHLREAEHAALLGRRFAAQFHLQHLGAADLGAGEHYVRRGRSYLCLGQWQNAAADLGEAVARKVDPPDVLPDVWLEYALMLLQSRDLTRYHQVCQTLVGRISQGQSGQPWVNVPQICVLGPNPPATLAPLLKRLRQMKKAPGQDPASTTGQDGDWMLDGHVVGALLYRAGEFKEAVKALPRSLGQTRLGDPTAQDWLFLAMAHYRLGHADQARQALDKADELLKEVSPGPWTGIDLPQGALAYPYLWAELDLRLELEVLRLEAAALINRR